MSAVLASKSGACDVIHGGTCHGLRFIERQIRRTCESEMEMPRSSRRIRPTSGIDMRALEPAPP